MDDGHKPRIISFTEALEAQKREVEYWAKLLSHTNPSDTQRTLIVRMMSAYKQLVILEEKGRP